MCNWNAHLYVFFCLILVSLVCCAGPVVSPEESKDPGQESSVKKLVQPSTARSTQSHRQAGWRRGRRPRPRLSHKGPMPF
uniref:Apelin n=1 Tax=Erpetoichthys calabaricus TaxID=27687 RepID=A0A8C4SLT7_ERPCA